MVEVRPNAGFLGGGKEGAFGCEALSLDALLGYSRDGTRGEAAFEVALTAELLREALQARYGRLLLAGCVLIEAQHLEVEHCGACFHAACGL